MKPAAESPGADGRTAIFVYGTLKRGGENHTLLAGQRFLGTTRTVAGYRLYELDGYPGMVEDAADIEGVSGEVWEIDTATLRALDELEGVNEGLYARVPARLKSPFDRGNIETYLYLRSIAGRPDLKGEWLIP